MSEEQRLDEDAAWLIAVDDHPELKDDFEDGKLPDELEDENGNVWNPHMHLSLHAILECQIANDEPAGVRQAEKQLIDAGVDRHESRHLLARPLTEQLFEMTKNEAKFNEEIYMQEIAEIVKQNTGQ